MNDDIKYIILQYLSNDKLGTIKIMCLSKGTKQYIENYTYKNAKLASRKYIDSAINSLYKGTKINEKERSKYIGFLIRWIFFTDEEGKAKIYKSIGKYISKTIESTVLKLGIRAAVEDNAVSLRPFLHLPPFDFREVETQKHGNMKDDIVIKLKLNYIYEVTICGNKGKKVTHFSASSKFAPKQYKINCDVYNLDDFGPNLDEALFKISRILLIWNEMKK